MHRRFSALFCMFAWLLSLSLAAADFEQVDGPYDGHVTSFVKDSFSGKLYASGVGLGLGGGVFVSSDNGDSWARVSGNSQLGETTVNDPPHYGGFQEDIALANVTNYRIGTGNFKLGIDHTSNPNTLYVAYFYSNAPRKVMRSTDGGANWAVFNSGVSAAFMPFDFAQAPNGDMYMAGFNDTGVYRLPLGGGTWVACTTTTNNALAIAVDQANGDVYFTNMQNSLDANRPAVFRSTTQGSSFVGVTVPTSLVGGGAADAGSYNRLVNSIAIDNSISPPVIHVGFKDRTNWLTSTNIATGGNLRSTDYGATWSSGTARNVESMTVDAAGRVFLGLADNATYYGALYASNDRGLSFSKVNDAGINDAAWIISLQALGGGQIMAGADGAYRSMDNGATWTHLDGRGLKASRRTTDVAVDTDGTLYAASPQHGLSRSTDGGATWSIANGSGASRLGSLWVTTVGVDPATHAVYAGTGLASSSGRFYRSTDKGASWAQVTTFTAQYQAMEVAFAKNGNVVFGGMYGGPGGAFVSTNGGATCFASTGTSPGQSNFSMAVDPVHGDIYMGTETLGTWLSTDNGLSFSQVGWSYASLNGCNGTQLGNKGNVFSLAVDATGSTVYGAALHGLFKSNDKGATWQEVAVPGLGGCGMAGQAVITDSGTGIYFHYAEGAATGLPKLKRSNDGGLTWSPFNTGLPIDSRPVAGTQSMLFDAVDGKIYLGLSGNTLNIKQGTYGLFRSVLPVVAPLSTPTPSFSPSPTRSATPNATATPTPSASGSPTATPTASPTGSPSASPTATATASPTGSPSASSTATATASPTDSPSASPSASQTASCSATPSASATATPTPSVTVVASATASPTPTPTGTFPGSPTDSPTVSASATETLSNTASPSATGTATASATASATPSSTASPSASPTASASSTSSASPTASPTASESASATCSPSATPSPSQTPSPSASPSDTASATPSSSSTASPTSTVSPSASVTATPTPSGTASPTATPSPTPGPSGTSTPTPSITPTFTPAPPANGPPKVEELVALPNPDPLAVQLRLAGPADTVELKLYSSAYNLLARLSTGPLPGGWNQVALPAEFLGVLPNGLFYLHATGKKDGAVEKGVTCKVYVLR